MIPFLDLKAQYASIKDEVDAAIHGVLDSCAYVLGPEVVEFEASQARAAGQKFEGDAAEITAKVVDLLANEANVL